VSHVVDVASGSQQIPHRAMWSCKASKRRSAVCMTAVLQQVRAYVSHAYDGNPDERRSVMCYMRAAPQRVRGIMVEDGHLHALVGSDP